MRRDVVPTKDEPLKAGCPPVARVKFRWKVSFRSSSPFTLETSTRRRPRSGAGALAHLAAARPQVRGGGGAGGGGGGAGHRVPPDVRAGWAPPRPGPPCAPWSTELGGGSGAEPGIRAAQPPADARSKSCAQAFSLLLLSS